MTYTTAILRDGDKIVRVEPLPNGPTPIVEVASVRYHISAASEDRGYALYERER